MRKQLGRAVETMAPEQLELFEGFPSWARKGQGSSVHWMRRFASRRPVLGIRQPLSKWAQAGSRAVAWFP